MKDKKTNKNPEFNTPKTQNKIRFGWKVWVSIILVLVLALGSAISAIAFSIQPKFSIKDYTIGVADNEKKTKDDVTETEAILNPNVILFEGKDANKVNKAIQSTSITNQGIYLQIEDGSPIGKLGKGDVFFLEGDAKTPLGEPFFGKIVSVNDGGNVDTYCVETPMVDEVFDKLALDYEAQMTTDNISEIQLAEGVTVETVKSAENHIENLSQTTDVDTPQVTMLSSSDSVETIKGSGEDLVFTLKLDILKIFGQKEKAKEGFKDRRPESEGQNITVYTTDNGRCYHKDGCRYLHSSQNATSLINAINSLYKACTVCKPPVLDVEEAEEELKEDSEENTGENTDESTTEPKKKNGFEPKLELIGSVGLSEVNFSVTYDLDISKSNPLQDLVVAANGTFIADVSLEGGFELELGGDDTEIDLGFLKFEALKEKTFPLAFIGYTGSVVTKAKSNEEIRMVTTPMPITIGAIVYVDIEGKVGVSAELFFNYKRDFSYTNVIVKDGEWLNESEKSTDKPNINYGFKAEATGDIDANLGASLALYIFNLNPVDIAVVKVGAEAEGTVELNIDQDTLSGNGELFSYDAYMRLYFKLFDINIKLKCAVDIWVLQAGLNVDLNLVLLDHTLWETGKKSPTRYDAATMSYTSMTAKDSDAVYYKDTNGLLIREKNNYRTAIYTEEFFAICGIDETFIYILREADVGTYDLYRVSKENGDKVKLIVDDISNVFANDEKYIYYLTDFDSTVVYKMDRHDQKEETFHDFDDTVTFMSENNGEFYAVVGTSFFFYHDFTYYLLNSNGTIIQEYGYNDVPVEGMCLKEFGDYYQAAKMASAGYLRNTASEVHWLSPDKSSSVLTENISGWNAKDVGIFTVLNNYGAGENAEPYKIVLYKSKNGQQTYVTDISHTQSFFTLCQSPSGEWYFIDQKDGQSILYCLEADFSKKTVVKTFTREEIPYDLSECSMVIVDGRLYFYTMPNDTTSEMLYRYDLYKGGK